MFSLLRIAVRNIVQHRRRSLLVAGAVAAVSFLVVALFGLIHAARSNLYDTATAFYVGELNLSGIYKLSPGSAEQMVTHADQLEALVREQVPETQSIESRIVGAATLSGTRVSVRNLFVAGMNPDEVERVGRLLHISEGKLSDLLQPDTVLLFRGQAKKLGVGVGDVVTLSGLTTRQAHNAIDVRVVAIADNSGGLLSHLALVPSVTARNFFQYREAATAMLQIQLTPGTDVNEVQERLRAALATKGHRLLEEEFHEWSEKEEWAESQPWTGQVLEVARWDELIGQAGFLSAIDALIGLLTFLLLAIASVGVMNTMWIAIRERTKEIGTLRAIGMQRRAVVRLFMTESVLLGGLGGVAGIVLAVVVGAIVNVAHIPVPDTLQVFLGMGEFVTLQFSPGIVIGTTVTIVFFTAFISIWPSYLASRVSPITAMGHVS